MNIKSTINIKKSQAVKLKSIAKQFDVTVSFIFNRLVSKALRYNKHNAQVFKSVKYQRTLSGNNDSWYCQHISLTGDNYEKCLDVRNVFKISVSFFCSFAIESYIQQVIQELEEGIKSDNYPSNYIVFHTRNEYYSIIIQVWDEIEEERLEKLKRALK